MIGTLIIIILFFCSPILSHGAMSAHAAVVINEIYPKPGDGTSEWIELYNTGSETVDLNLWKLENTNGEKKEFPISASSRINPNSFLIFNRSQTNISLSDSGDIVNLYDASGAKVDSQGFPSTIGTNRSAGRSPDGTGQWSQDCPSPATPNAPNNCVAATPTSTPLPTSIPPPPPAAVVAPADPAPPAATPLPGVSVIIPEVLGVMRTPTPSPLPPDLVKIEVPKSIIISKNTIVQILVVAISWGIIAIGAMIQRKLSRRKHKMHPPQAGPPSV